MLELREVTDRAQKEALCRQNHAACTAQTSVVIAEEGGALRGVCIGEEAGETLLVRTAFAGEPADLWLLDGLLRTAMNAARKKGLKQVSFDELSARFDCHICSKLPYLRKHSGEIDEILTECKS